MGIWVTGLCSVAFHDLRQQNWARPNAAPLVCIRFLQEDAELCRIISVIKVCAVDPTCLFNGGGDLFPVNGQLGYT